MRASTDRILTTHVGSLQTPEYTDPVKFNEMTDAMRALYADLDLWIVDSLRRRPHPTHPSLGQALMLRSSALGIPLELIYFALLAFALHAHPQFPKGWYWRSFEHHHLLSQSQRRWVLPFFYVGALAFLGIALGIGMVLLGGISALQQR